MISAFRRSVAASIAGALVGTLPLGAPAAPAGAVLPVTWGLGPTQIASSCASAIAAFRKRVDAIVAGRGARTFGTVVLPLENASSDLNDVLAAQTFLYNVATDAAVRNASLKCSTDEGNVLSEVQARPDLYQALVTAQRSGTVNGEAETKLTQLWVTALKRSGAGLPPAQRRQFVTLEQRLIDLQNRYMANLGNDASTIAISAADAAPLPPDFVAAQLKKNADGTYTVPVNESTVSPFLNNETDATARKAYYVSYNRRGGEQNVALLTQAIGVRDQLAHLLGYPTWAAYQLADKMAGTPQRVESFLSQIDTAILPKARQERDELAQLKGGPLDQWDQTYYENQYRKTKYDVDENAIKQYFPVQHVIDSVLAIYQQLLGVRFARIDVPVWVPQVQAYSVTDATTGALLGRFYLDLFPRPGKYDHFANFPLIARRVLPDGSVRLAESAIVGNWPQPAPGKPALLTHEDVVTFFHEFGHNMAAMLATGPYETLTNGFRSDFIEAPSQMLENFAWDPAILKRVSSNVTTAQPLPDDLIRKLIATRYVHYALATTSQILYGTVDMKYHTMKPPFDPTTVWAQTVTQTTPNQFVPGTHPESEFGHLMSGYDAGYYGYLWSKVYAQDIFSRFQSQGLLDPAVGMAYRRDILAPAREEEPDQEVRAFLGRPMNPSAFYRELGITAPVATHP
jgi:thimet oligopeptidase